MKTNHAWGWLVAAVLAAVLNATYHDGGLQWAHRIADGVSDNAASVVALTSGSAGRFLAEARMLTVRNEAASCPLTAVMTRVQSRIDRSRGGFDRFEAMSAREEAQLASLEANRARMEARIIAHTARFRIATAAFAPINIKALPAPVVCPRVRVNIPKLPMVEMPAIPEIHVEVAGTGPV
jgi:hypothetical protein